MWAVGITGCAKHPVINRLVNALLAIVTWLRLGKPADSGITQALSTDDDSQAPMRPRPRASVAASAVVGSREFLQNTAMIMMIMNLDSFGLVGR
jgi:hypothetical protein